jgi:hypothetical protein
LLVARLQSRITRLAENFILLIVTIQARRERDLRCQAILADGSANKGFEIAVEMALVGIIQFLGQRGQIADFVSCSPVDADSRTLAITPCTTMIVRPLPSRNG